MAGSLKVELSAAERQLGSSDPAIAALIARLGPRAVERRGYAGPFEALARIVIGQQVSTAAARTIWGRVRTEFGDQAPTAAQAASGAERLRACGLSARKASYIAGIGEAVVAGRIDLEALAEASDDEVISTLTGLRGLGRWSAEMFLIFALGRPDVFSGGDLGLRNGIRLAHRLERAPSPEEASEIAERWRPNRSLAAIYLWAAVAAEPG